MPEVLMHLGIRFAPAERSLRLIEVFGDRLKLEPSNSNMEGCLEPQVCPDPCETPMLR